MRPSNPSWKSRRHSTGDASPLAALLLHRILLDILRRRALRSGRLAGLGAAPGLPPRAASVLAALLLIVHPLSAAAEVTAVTITSRAVVADGKSFGSTGPYEKLAGRIDFALDPADPHNSRIVDLTLAPRGADGRVHFSSDLFVIRPVDAAKGNGVLLFEIPTRRGKGLLPRFNGDATRCGAVFMSFREDFPVEMRRSSRSPSVRALLSAWIAWPGCWTWSARRDRADPGGGG